MPPYPTDVSAGAFSTGRQRITVDFSAPLSRRVGRRVGRRRERVRGVLGLSGDTGFDVPAVTPLAAQAERCRPAMEFGEYPARFSLSLAHKDANLIHDAAGKAGLDLRLSNAAPGRLGDAEKGGWGDRDYIAILAWILGAGDKPSSAD